MKTILIIEDDPSLLRVYRDKFTAAGFAVRVAVDGVAGIAALNEKPDLVILDLLLPKKDGFAVLETMHTHGTWKNIPVLVASNLGVEEDMEKAKKMGATDYFVKSDVTLADLVSKVKKILE
jgi:DNA-binding response OmpR family regulator